MAPKYPVFRSSVNDRVKKIETSVESVAANSVESLLPVTFIPPLAPSDYALESGVEIIQGQLPIRNNDNIQVDSFGLPYQDGLTNDWDVEFVNSILSNGIVANVDNKITYTGTPQYKNNMYATKSIDNADGLSLRGTIVNDVDSTDHIPLVLASSLPTQSADASKLDSTLTSINGTRDVVYLQEPGINIVNVYKKDPTDDWYKQVSDLSVSGSLTPSITGINGPVTQSVTLNSFSNGWDEIVYYSDKKWRLTSTGVTSWSTNMPEEYAAAGSPQAGFVGDMSFYKNSPFLFNNSRRFLSSYLGKNVEPSVVPSDFTTPLSDTNYGGLVVAALDIPVSGELDVANIVPTTVSGIRTPSDFSMCFSRYGNDNNVKNILRTVSQNTFKIDMGINGRVPSLGAVLLREPVGMVWTVEFTIQMKREGLLGAHGWQKENADIYNTFNGGSSPNFPDTGFFFGVLSDPNDKTSRSFNTGTNKAKMINMVFGGTQNNFAGNKPGGRLESPLQAAAIPTLQNMYEPLKMRIESKESGDPTYPSAIRVSLYQDSIWKIIDTTANAWVDTQGFGTYSTTGGYLGFQLESSSFTISDFTLTV